VLTIGVDVGGTKVAAGVVDEEGTVLATTRRPTPSASPTDVEEVIAACVAELRRDHSVEAVGVGAAGFIDAGRSRVFVAPNLSWRDEPLRDAVAARVGLPVVVENDANAAAWAEHQFGAGRGEPHLVVVTVGDRASAAASCWDGRLYRGRFGHRGGVRATSRSCRRPALRVRPVRLLGAVLLRPAPCCARRARSPTSARPTAAGCSSSAAAGRGASRRRR
jgi:predicted NBD/HSP70 family sugar kinase